VSRSWLRRPSPALVISTIALVAALGGTSYAAFSLPKNSVGTKQLKNGAVTGPKIKNGAVSAAKLNVTGVTVPNALHANSANTAGSATNAANANHATTAGSAPLPTTLPSGESLTGAYALIGHAAAVSERAGTAISFEIPLASAPTAHFIGKGTTPPAQCPGTPTNPKAAPGNLCIYESQSVNLSFQSFEDPITGSTGSTVQPFGAEVVALSSAAGNYDDSGSWAVTAP
jgi:hypothetical protein